MTKSRPKYWIFFYAFFYSYKFFTVFWVNLIELTFNIALKNIDIKDILKTRGSTYTPSPLAGPHLVEDRVPKYRQFSQTREFDV